MNALDMKTLGRTGRLELSRGRDELPRLAQFGSGFAALHCNSRDCSQAASKAKAVLARGHSCPLQAPNVGAARLPLRPSARRTLLRKRMSARLRLRLCRAASLASLRFNRAFSNCSAYPLTA